MTMSVRERAIRAVRDMLQIGGGPEGRFSAVALDLGFGATARDTWVTEVDGLTLREGFEPLFSFERDAVIARAEAGLVLITLCRTTLEATCAAATRDDAETLLDRVRGLFPETKPEERECARTVFWNFGGRSAIARHRDIGTPPWVSIQGNYSSTVRDDLAALMGRTEVVEGGRLILWHGPPGTGKTHLIRALAYAWSSWCTTEYVVDIDALLRGSSVYLTELILDGGTVEDPDRWRLIVLEDAGEFLLPDAAQSQGQGFSRLLNTLDGLLGQTANIMLLVTTNRPLTALDPAVTRPGRCAMEMEIPEFTAGEAAEWLAARGHAGPVAGPATLAQLYAVLRGEAPPKPRRAVGFAA